LKLDDQNCSKQKYVNNLNSDNYEGLYLLSNLDKIKISWYNSNVPVNIEIIHINQNVQRIMNGMTENAYAS
jgi:PII-like signaling protein